MSPPKKGRSTSSQMWLSRQRRDPYVQAAKQNGYRSRASYKLIQIQEKDRIIRPGDAVLDLGAAPGGWSQLLPQWVGPTGCVVACDLLSMDTIPGVHLIQGDFNEQATQQALLDALAKPVDALVSDMAPNTRGVQQADQLAAMALVEAVVCFAHEHLRPGGNMVIKAFQGCGFDAIHQQLKQTFHALHIRKPDASRQGSREMYWVAKGFKPHHP